MGCFNFERVKALIFKLFGRCFKPTVWDGDTSITSHSLPTASVPSPPRGMATYTSLSQPLKRLQMCSKPTGWDGDKPKSLKILSSSASSKPTVWDGDSQMGDGRVGMWMRWCFSSKPTAWDGDS